MFFGKTEEVDTFASKDIEVATKIAAVLAFTRAEHGVEVSQVIHRPVSIPRIPRST